VPNVSPFEQNSVVTARKKSRKRRRFGSTDQPSPGGLVRLRYRVNGDRQTEWAHNFEDAARRLSLIEADVLRGKWKPPRQEKLTVAQVATSWIESKRQTASTIARDKSVLKRWWLPTLGSRPISTITREDLQRVLRMMTSEGRAAKTVRTNFGVIRAVLKFAEDEGIITRAPVKRIVLPDIEPVEHPSASVDVLLALVDELPARYTLLGWLLGVCGLRWSEAIALQVGDIDLDRTVINIRRTLVEVSGNFHEGRGKTKGSAGRVSMPSHVAQAYREHLLVMGARSDDDLLFTAPRGGPVRASNFRNRVWTPAIERAGARGYSARELRQVSAALMREGGADEHEVSVRLRHTHRATSSDVYGGITADRHTALDRGVSAVILSHRVTQGSDQSGSDAG
jgi:integrase